VDIRQVPASGPAGRVTPEDVRAFAAVGDAEPAAEASRLADPAHVAAETAAGPSAIPFFGLEPMADFERYGPVEREPIRSIRRKVARKMVTSMVVVPHVIHMDEADVTELDALRRRHNEAHPEGPRLSLLALVTKAAVSGLRRSPMFNASLDPDRGEIIYKRYYNIGLAADTPKGLMVPVVKEADRKSVLEVASEIGELAARARAGDIALEELQGGTFTITNIGPLGGIALAPAINYPEVAILGMGKAEDKAVVRQGEIVVRKMLPLTLSFDHRVADGADAARFVTRIVRLLGHTDTLLLEV
jgi:pyruvate dehydrogenase E2 component (dihydrolipoamide acetyltransferase)